MLDTAEFYCYHSHCNNIVIVQVLWHERGVLEEPGRQPTAAAPRRPAASAAAAAAAAGWPGSTAGGRWRGWGTAAAAAATAYQPGIRRCYYNV